MKFVDHRVCDYLKELSGENAVPGGGSASALSASLGIALLLMVASHIEKKKTLTASGQAGIKKAKAGLAALLAQAKSIIDKDPELFLNYLESVKSKDARATKIALKLISEPPIEICGLCMRAVKCAGGIAALAGRNIISDIAAGIAMLEAAFKSSIMNIEINFKYAGNSGSAAHKKIVKMSQDFFKRSDAIVDNALLKIRN